MNRVMAAASKEAWTNPTLGGTPFGQQIKDNAAAGASELIWPCAVDNESAYEYALEAGNPDPGGDPAVITDANILAAVQAHWPST